MLKLSYILNSISHEHKSLLKSCLYVISLIKGFDV